MARPRVTHKSIYDPVDARRDGFRLLVTRTWPRGVRKSAVDAWEPALGSPPALIRKKKSGGLRMPELRRRYLAALDAGAQDRALAIARRRRVTLLCACRDEVCHRVVLAGVLNERLGDPKPRGGLQKARGGPRG